MSRTLPRSSVLLIGLSLVLIFLANLGLTVHGEHHVLDDTYSGASTILVAGHSTPDSTLHLEEVAEVRTLSCPGCLLQHQIGQSQLPGASSLDRPAVGEIGIRAVSPQALVQPFSPRAPRGPPSC